MIYHTPVLLQETIELLRPSPGELFIDATVGGAGHTIEILKRGARVLGIDQDPEAISYLKEKIRDWQNLILVQSNFNKIEEIAKREGFEKASGILLDLGVSSFQIESPNRGFSHTKEGPLDMRMDPSLTVRAYDLVNNFDQRRLYEIFKTYGQEKFSRAISKAICSTRQIKPIETTTELSKIIDEVLPSHPQSRRGRTGSKTRVFQALRIVVNSELLNLEEALPQTVELLQKGGRLVVISFHSLEDGLVKRFFKSEKRLKILTKKPIGPGETERIINPRSRSARLRAAEKI